MPPSSNRRITSPSRSAAVIVSVVVALVALFLAWSLTPLDRLLDPGFVSAYRDRIGAWTFAPLLAVSAFVVGGFVCAPSTLLTGATVLVFGPVVGPLYAMIGLLASATATCLAARHLVRDSVDQWLAARGGSWVGTLRPRLERNGFLAVILMRLTPMPFTLQNLIIGVSRVGLVEIILGTAIGVVPVIALMAGVTTRLDAWLAHPDWVRLVLLIGATFVTFAIVWILKRWAVRRSAGR